MSITIKPGGVVETLADSMTLPVASTTLLSTSETQERLGCSRSTLRDYVAAGRITPVRLDRAKKRYSLLSIARMIDDATESDE